MTKRQSSRPDRRFLPDGSLTLEQREGLAKQVTYAGSGNHKLRPGDYGFSPPANPRPSKSPCDELRPVLKAEASRLLHAGIRAGLVSQFTPGGVPKYIWAVDVGGEVYEAKTAPNSEKAYHGYRLGDDDADMRQLLKKEWRRRCRTG